MSDTARHTDDGLMDVRAVVAYTSLSESLIRKRTAAGTIPVVRIGRRTLYRRDEIDAWIESERGKASAGDVAGRAA